MPQKKDSLIINFTSRGKGFCRFPVVNVIMMMTMILIRMVTGTDNVDDDDENRVDFKSDR